jgi:hypothetical protein
MKLKTRYPNQKVYNAGLYAEPDPTGNPQARPTTARYIVSPCNFLEPSGECAFAISHTGVNLIRRTTSTVFLVCALACQIVIAQSLPKPVLSAKTIFLASDSVDHKVFDHLAPKLNEWGRWRLVERRQDADIVLVFAERQTNVGAMATGTTTGNVASATAVPLTSDQRFLIALDKDGEKYVLVSCERRLGAGYTAGVLVNRLKKRIEQAEKAGHQ